MPLKIAVFRPIPSASESGKATGCQIHSVRGFLSGILGKHKGLESSKTNDGERAYRLGDVESARTKLSPARRWLTAFPLAVSSHRDCDSAAASPVTCSGAL